MPFRAEYARIVNCGDRASRAYPRISGTYPPIARSAAGLYHEAM